MTEIIETKENIKRVLVANSNQQPLAKEPKLIKISGILTKRIELRGENTKESYYYSFVKLKRQMTDLPVVFKVNSDPPFNQATIPKGSLIELQGYYSNSSENIRKSFTAYSYEIITQEANSLTLSELKSEIQSLLAIATKKHQKWHQWRGFFSKKLSEIEELANFTKLDAKYCQAYLLVKDIHYTNYQENFPNPNFTLEEYLNQVTKEINLVKAKMTTGKNE